MTHTPDSTNPPRAAGRRFDYYRHLDDHDYGLDGYLRIPDNDPLLAALVREHGAAGRPDIATALRHAPPDLWSDHVKKEKPTMKTLALAAVLALTLTAVIAEASAAEFPREYRGAWCMTEGHPYYTPRAKGDSCEDVITILADRYRGDDYECLLLGRKPGDLKPPEMVGEFRCVVEDKVNPNSVTSRFVITTGTKGRGKRLYTEDLEDGRRK